MWATRGFLITHCKIGIHCLLSPKTGENNLESTKSSGPHNPMQQQTSVMGVHILNTNQCWIRISVEYESECSLIPNIYNLEKRTKHLLTIVYATTRVSSDVYSPDGFILTIFHFSWRWGGDGGETSVSPAASYLSFNFSSIIFFTSNSYPPWDNLWGYLLLAWVYCAFCLFSYINNTLIHYVILKWNLIHELHNKSN